MDRKNINRDFKKLRVRQDAISLYIFSCKIFATFPFEFKKVAANSIDNQNKDNPLLGNAMIVMTGRLSPEPTNTLMEK